MKISLDCGDLDERLGNVNLREGSIGTAEKQVTAITATFDTRVGTWKTDKERMLAALRIGRHKAEIDKVKSRMRHVDNGVTEVRRHLRKLVGALTSLSKFELMDAAESAEPEVPALEEPAKRLPVDESLLLSPEEMDRLVFGKGEPHGAPEPAEPPAEAPRRAKRNRPRPGK